MNTADYMQWYYLIYVLPGGAALLLLLLSALSGGGRHHRIGAGHGHHAVSGHHHAVRHHTGAKHQSPNQAATARPSMAQQALAFFGVGRVPGLFLCGCALLGWGLFGFWATRMVEPILRFPAVFALPALGIAALGALGTAKMTAEIGARLLPRDETFATGTIELCGLTGTVTFPVDTARGRVHVYDTHGTLHDVSARVASGQIPLARGRRALVTDYDAAGGFVIVEEIG